MLRKSFSSYLRQGLLLAFLAAFSTLWLAQAHAERRAAIVVGNSEYPFAPLTNPRNDAKLIANTLTELKFDVLLFYDVKKSAEKDLNDAIRAHLIGADMGNRYAPYFMAQLYLKGDRKLAADPRRALTLLELSANRGNEYAYVRLAWGHRDGLFTGKPDLRRAYFDASLAARLRADQGEQAKAEIAKKIDPATRKEIDGEVELYIKQNGP